MKKTIITLGLLITVSAVFAQNQPDSIHIVVHQNVHGNERNLDTIVPISQQQALFTWMQAHGWDAPPPPPAPPAPPAPGAPRHFEQEIIIEGDSALVPGGNHRMIFVEIDGDSMTMPPPPSGCHMRTAGEQGKEGDVMIMRAPMLPPPPGSTVEVNVQHKDTIIDGKKRTMIMRTEKIILPEGVQPPPAPPAPPKAPTAPQAPKQPMPGEHQKQLVVYPNPTTSVLNVEFDVNANEKTTLRVLDANGKVVYEEAIKESESKHVKREIDLGGKSKGTYTVEVKSDKRMIAETVIVQ